MGKCEMNVPRGEYPRPQFVRKDWLCLNGRWQFEIDNGDDGLERGLLDKPLKDTILVPFCPESELSGIGRTDFIKAVWYRRSVRIPDDWAGRDVLLHFQAVDYDATVWANGQEVGRHRGGWCGFTCDLSKIAGAGDEITIAVRARDDMTIAKAGGKQSRRLENFGCFYTRTTGIWQTVWLEPVPRAHLARPRITPDVANGMFRLALPVANGRAGMAVRATLRDEGGTISTASSATSEDFTAHLDLAVCENRRRLWQPGAGYLYDIDLELLDADGTVVDRASTYAGLRSVTIDGKAVRINGEVVFQRLVLDQGYYGDGILTAPNDEALRKDIELSMAAGFNGARLHQKVFEERFLYHADRMGYLVWGEFGDWGIDVAQPGETLIAQWLEVLGRDYSHPGIVGWCPLNETCELLSDQISPLADVTRGMFLATKAADPTRPVLDVSGYSHRVEESDVYDSHNYTQDPAEFAGIMAGLAVGQPFVNSHKNHSSTPYNGQPYFVSEFGGIWWNEEIAKTAGGDNDDNADNADDSWGYGQRVRTVEEFYERFAGLCNVLLDDPNMFGYCYTQLTDVFQEQNGLYAFDRKAKFDLARIRAIQQRPAAIETRAEEH